MNTDSIATKAHKAHKGFSLSPSDGEGARVRGCVRTIPTLVLAAVLFCGYAKAQTSNLVVYVADFELEAADIKSEKGVLPPPPKLPGPLGNVLPPPPGTPKDPKKLARELVDEMSESLVKELTKSGFTARRLTSTNNLPPSGWLVRGVFTQVNQGNQLQRAVIGFGKGKTDLQVVVDIADLAHGTPKKFYELNTTATSGKLPGAGPMIVLCPAGAAAHFVIAGGDLNRNVKQTAKQIAAEVAKRYD